MPDTRPRGQPSWERGQHYMRPRTKSRPDVRLRLRPKILVSRPCFLEDLTSQHIAWSEFIPDLHPRPLRHLMSQARLRRLQLSTVLSSHHLHRRPRLRHSQDLSFPTHEATEYNNDTQTSYKCRPEAKTATWKQCKNWHECHTTKCRNWN